MEHINDFRVVGGLELLCWIVETILFPNDLQVALNPNRTYSISSCKSHCYFRDSTLDTTLTALRYHLNVT